MKHWEDIDVKVVDYKINPTTIIHGEGHSKYFYEKEKSNPSQVYVIWSKDLFTDIKTANEIKEFTNQFLFEMVSPYKLLEMSAKIRSFIRKLYLHDNKIFTSEQIGDKVGMVILREEPYFEFYK